MDGDGEPEIDDAAEPAAFIGPVLPPPLPDEPPRPARSLRLWIAGGVALALLVVGAVGVVLTQRDDEAGLSGWPDDIRPLAQLVEDERGLEFKHTVPVEFLTDAEFRDQVTADESELTGQDRRDIEHSAALLRAVGLLDDDVDLFDASNDLNGAGIVGYYSNEDQVIHMRRETLTPSSRATLVHELTHALQDQYFDIGGHLDDFEDSDDPSAALAYRALVEGDANRIEGVYLGGLNSDERAEIDDEGADAVSEFEGETADLPGVLRTMAGAPYALGQAMLDLAITTDDNDAVDALFRDPPTTDEQLLDPWTLVNDRDEPLAVEKPPLPSGEKEFDSGTFGAVMWYLMLAERLPLVDALDAVDGWGGDSYVAFERADVTCVRVRYAGDTGDDTDEMRAALQDWAAAVPPSKASVVDDGDDLLFEACDPGDDAEPGSDTSDDALQLALTRTYVAIGIMQSVADDDIARCIGDEFVHEFTVDQLTDPEFGLTDPEVQDELRAIGEGCGAGS